MKARSPFLLRLSDGSRNAPSRKRRASMIPIAVILIVVMTCVAWIRSDHRGRGRAAGPTTLVIVDPRFQRVDLLIHQIVVLRSTMAHSRDVIHRQESLRLLLPEGLFDQPLVARGLIGGHC